MSRTPRSPVRRSTAGSLQFARDARTRNARQHSTTPQRGWLMQFLIRSPFSSSCLAFSSRASESSFSKRESHFCESQSLSHWLHITARINSARTPSTSAFHYASHLVTLSRRAGVRVAQPTSRNLQTTTRQKLRERDCASSQLLHYNALTA